MTQAKTVAAKLVRWVSLFALILSVTPVSIPTALAATSSAPAALLVQAEAPGDHRRFCRCIATG